MNGCTEGIKEFCDDSRLITDSGEQQKETAKRSCENSRKADTSKTGKTDMLTKDIPLKAKFVQRTGRRNYSSKLNNRANAVL